MLLQALPTGFERQDTVTSPLSPTMDTIWEPVMATSQAPNWVCRMGALPKAEQRKRLNQEPSGKRVWPWEAGPAFPSSVTHSCGSLFSSVKPPTCSPAWLQGPAPGRPAQAAEQDLAMYREASNPTPPDEW